MMSPGELAQRRLALRRGGPCGTTGRVLRGFNRGTIRRVGDLSDTGAGRANLSKRGNIHRAGESATCGPSCAPGTVLVTMSLPATVRIATDSIAIGPTWGVYEIPVGTFSCVTMQITVTLDYKYIGGGTGIHVYLSPSGQTLSSRGFVGTNILIPQLANTPTIADGAFHTYTFVQYPANTPAFVNFAGPLPVPQSVYLWPPALFPGFSSATVDVKNVNITITSI